MAKWPTVPAYGILRNVIISINHVRTRQSKCHLPEVPEAKVTGAKCSTTVHQFRLE